MDELAAEYAAAGKPVLFLEHSVAHPVGNRIDRWWAAADPSSDCGVPLVAVDSGWRWTCGAEDFRPVYTNLVDQALARPAGVELSGSYSRTGSDVDVWMDVTNKSGVMLSPENDATANAMVYENARVIYTDRFVRAAGDFPIRMPLAVGARASYRVRLTDVPVEQWDRAQVVVLVDYRPDPGSEHYEALQAAVAVEEPTATPTMVTSPTADVSATPTGEASASPTMEPGTGTPPATAGVTASPAPAAAAYLPAMLSNAALPVTSRRR